MLKSKCITIAAVIFVTLLTLPVSSESQELWKVNWAAQIVVLDSTFYPIQRQLRHSRTYQNDAKEDQILADIDSLYRFRTEINKVIEQCSQLEMPDTNEGANAGEAMKLKIEALKEYLDQCQIQVRVNNQILQKKLKNESLDFKVSETEDLMKGVLTFKPNLK